MLELALGPNLDASGSNHTKWKHAMDLLHIDNGNWAAGYITHHCGGLYCCPHGLPEARRKVWAAVLVPVLQLAKWTELA